jgi:hypothetical protein
MTMSQQALFVCSAVAVHVFVCLTQDGSEGDSRYLAPELLNIKGSKRPPADLFSLGMSVFELAWNVVLVGRGDAWSALRQGKLPDIDPTLGRSQALMDLVRRVRWCCRWPASEALTQAMLVAVPFEVGFAHTWLSLRCFRC